MRKISSTVEALIRGEIERLEALTKKHRKAARGAGQHQPEDAEDLHTKANELEARAMTLDSELFDLIH